MPKTLRIPRENPKILTVFLSIFVYRQKPPVYNLNGTNGFDGLTFLTVLSLRLRSVLLSLIIFFFYQKKYKYRQYRQVTVSEKLTCYYLMSSDLPKPDDITKDIVRISSGSSGGVVRCGRV
jgi:hypothetical protein